MGRATDPNADIHIEWRVYVCCWAAQHACKLPGDFVECGVNTGIFSLAIFNYMDLGAKRFYLFDTFQGIPEEPMSEAECPYALNANKRYYEDCWDMAQRNFAPFPNAILVRGTVPETLSTVTIGRVAYLAIDVNIVYREVAAMEHFWDKLVPGGIVVFDDYGWLSHVLQKEALDAFAARKGVQILTLPTGQGLLIKPS